MGEIGTVRYGTVQVRFRYGTVRVRYGSGTERGRTRRAPARRGR